MKMTLNCAGSVLLSCLLLSACSSSSDDEDMMVNSGDAASTIETDTDTDTDTDTETETETETDTETDTDTETGTETGTETETDVDAGGETDTTTDGGETDTATSTVDNSDTGGDTGDTAQALDLTLFKSGALLSSDVVDCTLSNGLESTCYELTVVGVPTDADIGPFCPETIDDTAESVGQWHDGMSGESFDIDGSFIVNLPNLYGDTNWALYDEATRQVRVTTTEEACRAAAQPNVEAEYQNSCVECSMDYFDNDVIQSTVLIPTNPELADSQSSLGSLVGVTLNGAVISPPAPVDDILGNYTIAAFDDCGGHINPAFGYHYHAATACNETGEQADDHAKLLGYAVDGFGIYGELDANGVASTDLDDCRGHTDDVRGYHYHAATAWENMFIGCTMGVVEASNVAPERTGPGGPGGPPPGE